MIDLFDMQCVNNFLQKRISTRIKDVLRSQSFMGGSFVNNFENEFADYLNVKHCISVDNGTDALEIAISSCSLPEKSEIIIPDCTFIATAEAVINTGHIPVIADVKDDFTISPDSIKSLISERTAAIICVHLYGNLCDMDEISAITKSRNLYIIEDAAQAHGSCYKGHYAGTLSDIGCFSFYPSKILGAFGNAGAIVTNSCDLAQKALIIRDHGRLDKDTHIQFGRNSRMDSIQAAVISEKLIILDKIIEKKRNNALVYNNALAEHNLISTTNPRSGSNYYQYVICSNHRDNLFSYLLECGITSGIYYPNTISQFPFVSSDSGRYEGYNSRQLFSKVLSLPSGWHVDNNTQQYIIERLLSFQ